MIFSEWVLGSDGTISISRGLVPPKRNLLFPWVFQPLEMNASIFDNEAVTQSHSLNGQRIFLKIEEKIKPRVGVG
jgi:hypothetical protein